MKIKNLKILPILIIIGASTAVVFTQSKKIDHSESPDKVTCNSGTKKNITHRYGGWYCPDNLNTFPAVNIIDWKNVPVIEGRLPSREETRSGSSLIFVDKQKYPNAKPIDMKLPRLATIYNQSSNKREHIIIIQAIEVEKDSIVGFRYLNGGNGSARINEVQFLTDNETQKIPNKKFVSHSIKIKGNQENIWNVITGTKHTKQLQKSFDSLSNLKFDWRKHTNVNYQYHSFGKQTAAYANKLFGNFYIQNDYEGYSDKFLLLEQKDSSFTELKISCGPFGKDYVKQKNILELWAKMVKDLSEGC